MTEGQSCHAVDFDVAREIELRVNVIYLNFMPRPDNDYGDGLIFLC